MGGKNGDIDLEQVRGLAEMLLSGEGQIPDTGSGLMDMLSEGKPAQQVPTPQSAIDDYDKWKQQPGARFSTVSEEDAKYPTVPPVEAPPEGASPPRFSFGKAIIEEEG